MQPQTGGGGDASSRDLGRSAIGHWTVYAKTGELHWSDEVYRIYGLEVGGKIDLKAAIEAYHPDDRDKVAEYVRRALEDKQDYQFDLRLILPGGELRHVRSTGVVRLDDAGDVDSVLGVFQDITETIRTERDLFEKTRFLMQAERLANIGHWIVYAETGALYWSDEVYRIHGLEVGGGVDLEAAVNCYHPDDRAKVAEYVRRALEEKQDYQFDLRLIRSDGEPRNVRSTGTVQLGDDGRVQTVFGVFQDITESKRIQDTLGEREAMLSAIVENLPVSLALKDREGRFTLVNPRFERLHGVTSNEVLGKTFFDILPHEIARDAAAEDRQVVESGEPLRTDYVWPAHLGVQRELIIKFPLRRRDGGPVIGVGVIALDITDQMRMEKQLLQAQKMEAVGQLTGGVAHDFNNLLAVILGNAELLDDDVGGDGVLTSPIIHAAERGAELTQRLLAFARKQPLNPQSIDLSELVLGMTELLSRTLGETIEVETHAAADLWSALADPGQVENAVLNLALNARDAMPEGGRLTIECVNADLDAAYVSRNPDASVGQFVCLSVSDTGTGMPADVKSRVFDPFFTTKDVGSGSGLGLSMVYGFAMQSGGHVSIQSEPGRGTTVNLCLRRAGDVAPAENVNRQEDIPRGRGEMILVIEDDPSVRMMAVRMLAGLGYRVTDVGDAAGGRDVLTNGDGIDLILTDVVLPGGTSGPEFAAEIEAEYPKLKVLLMSGYLAETAISGSAPGAGSPLLNKPFHIGQLARALRGALG